MSNLGFLIARVLLRNKKGTLLKVGLVMAERERKPAGFLLDIKDKGHISLHFTHTSKEIFETTSSKEFDKGSESYTNEKIHFILDFFFCWIG